MSVQLEACAVLHPVIQNRRLAGPTDGKGVSERRKISCSSRRSNPGIFQPQEHPINVKISVICFLFGSSWLSPGGCKIKKLAVKWLCLLAHMSRLVEWAGCGRACVQGSILPNSVNFLSAKFASLGSQPAGFPVEGKNLCRLTLCPEQLRRLHYIINTVTPEIYLKIFTNSVPTSL